VSVVANPRLLVLNNEPAIVRAVATETPSRDGAGAAFSEGFVLNVTPQISADGVVMLSLSPVMATRTPPDNPARERRSIHEADTLARVAGGETLVISGFTRERTVAAQTGRSGRNAPPTSRSRVAVLILLTPRIR